ncbi:MAG TPA: DUF417 family protein [Terriglobales bacterium]|nr:DUF417 family protein [Terriglobales bacterium]
MFSRSHAKFESIGLAVTRYGLVIVLLLIGLAKFTHAETQAIQPLVAHSPFMSWMYSILSTDGVSRVIGIVEITIGLLIALRPVAPKISLVGSLGAIITFLLTTSFLLSTPSAIQFANGLSILGDVGQFLIKDLVLLGGSIYVAAEALKAAYREGSVI